MKSIRRAMGWSLLLLCIAVAGHAADEYGIVMDTSKGVTIDRQGAQNAVTFGMTLYYGDRLTLAPEAALTIVAYDDCLEYVLKGADTLTIDAKAGLGSTTHAVKPSRQLPVCYAAEDIGQGDVIGGFVVRGKDRMADFRRDVEAGTASNSTLMMLIMHDLINGRTEIAAGYYEILKKRVPDDPFVQKLADAFTR